MCSWCLLVSRPTKTVQLLCQCKPAKPDLVSNILKRCSRECMLAAMLVTPTIVVAGALSTCLLKRFYLTLHDTKNPSIWGLAKLLCSTAAVTDDYSDDKHNKVNFSFNFNNLFK